MAAASVFTLSVLARPGTPFEQNVPVGEEPDEEPFDHMFLADNDLADFGLESVDKCAFALDFLVDGLDVECHGTSGCH